MLLVPSIPAAAKEMPEGTENLREYTFENVDGGTISSTSNGKTKVLILFSVNCGHCISVLSDIANSDWIQDGLADFCAVARDKKTVAVLENGQYVGKEVEVTKDEVIEFRANYCAKAGDKIQFGWGAQAWNAMSEYARVAGLENPDGTYTTPIIAIIDADNKLRDVTSGSAGVVDAMKGKLEAITSGNTPGNPDTPDNPDDSGNTDNPDNPDNSGNTDNPDNPDNSGNTDNPNNPDDSGNTDNPDNSGDSNNPDNPDDSQKPEQPEQPGTEESSNYQPACNHRTESVLVSSATASSDAVAISKCVKCGAVLSYEKVANSAYHTFLKETADAIANAQQPTVVIDAKMWVSFNRTVFEAIKSRPDVAVTVNYSYEGQKYVLQIPAGVNVDTLMDENGFGGFRYIDKVLSTKD